MINCSELTRARKQHGYNQTVLGHFLGVSQPFVSDMESGRKPLIQKAVDFINGENIAATPARTMDNAKNSKKVIFSEQKTNKIRSKKMPVFGSPGLSEKKHPLCLRCTRSCKQFGWVKIYCCPQFEAKNAKQETD